MIYAKHRAQREGYLLKQSAWLTASLVGFAKVPAFDQLFPDKEKTTDAGDLIAFFSAMPGVKVVNK